MKRTAGIVVVAGLLPGCAVESESEPEQVGEAASAFVTGSVIVDDVQRPYRLYVPDNAGAGDPKPVVVMLHGGGGNLDWAWATGMPQKGALEGFFVVALQGTPCDPIGGSPACVPDAFGNYPRTWNSGLTLDSGVEDVHDVLYVTKVLNKIVADGFHVDPTRFYVAGFSNGAMMAHKLAAKLPDKLAAVAAVEGTVGLDYHCGNPSCTAACGCSLGTACTQNRISPTPGSPISMVIVHGENDAVFPYTGDVGVCAMGAAGLDPVPLADAVDLWATQDGCWLAPTNTFNTYYTKKRHAGCASGTEVVRYFVYGMGHTWGTGTFATNDMLWSFFQAHHL